MWPFKKKTNPLETQVERAAGDIVQILQESGDDGPEVLDQAIAWYAPSFHLHANPMKKKKFEPITKVQ